jgi:hypothetical protein
VIGGKGAIRWNGVKTAKRVLAFPPKEEIETDIEKRNSPYSERAFRSGVKGLAFGVGGAGE